MKIKIQNGKQQNSLTKPSSTFSSLNTSMIKLAKQSAKHSKMPSNVSAFSGQNNSTTKKSTKQKKIENQAQDKKQKTIKQNELMTSGRKVLKHKIKNKKSCDFQFDKTYAHQNKEQCEQDCEEYCLVQDSFVPIVSKTQHKKLQDIMRSTADTTNRLDDLNRCTFRNMFPFRLKQSEKSSFSKDSQSEESVFVRSKKVSKKQVEVQALPLYSEIGIQYSQRPNFIKPLIEQIKEIKSREIDIQTEEIVKTKSISPMTRLDEAMILESQIEQQFQKQEVSQLKNIVTNPSPKKQQTLSDLLLKLEFKHLPNETSFNALSKTQKQHYSQLLSSLISKLNCSPRQKSPRQIKSKKQIQIEEVKLIPLEEIKIKHEKLQMEVFKRESSQMNWIQNRLQMNNKNDQDVIDTSMMAVNSFLLNFFCYIELNYMDSFLNNIKKQYGPSYSTEFQRIIRNLSKPKSQQKVLNLEAFQQFTEELSETSPYEKIHLKAIYDYTNDLLDCYRPYYQHRGQPFPWAVKIYNNICEYVIDQSSLQIIFVEVKQNIEKSVSMLCGLIIDENYYKDIGEVNPLTVKRNQKENFMIESWMHQKSDENHEIQCQATSVLNQVSQEIYNQLLLQILNEMKWL